MTTSRSKKANPVRDEDDWKRFCEEREQALTVPLAEVAEPHCEINRRKE